MAFNPLSIFNEKVKTQASPPRGPGGKFISTKAKKEEKTKEPKDSKAGTNEDSPNGPFPITFYGHTIRRFRYKGSWYFALEDIAKTAYINSDDPNVRKGDEEKLNQNKKTYALKFDGIEVAKPTDIINFVPYFKGNMPGPITSWLSENSDLPVPKSNQEN